MQLSDKIHRSNQLVSNLYFTINYEGDSISSKDVKNYEGNIDWNKLLISKGSDKLTLLNYNSIELITDNFAPGRFILTGENGSGKTTLLAQIKNFYGEKAFLLPQQSRLLFMNSIERK
ncbi:MAG: AAA family ATPase [Clostridiales bacterium]|jgi:recombinational DNA repair ATPase RecF|nr:AAA family ATPase [Clostridiales bacterium]